MTDATEAAAPGPGLSRGVTLAMAVACGVMVANIYYNQPLLGIMAREFHGAAAFVPTATQLGYAAGIILLVPLGDQMERRSLIVGQTCALAVALLALALAPGSWTLLAGSVLVGVAATAAQQILPFAAELADPRRRGATIGTLMSGLLCGILFGRTVAGFVGQHFGWRAVFGLSIVAALAAAATLAAVLPRGEVKARMPYRALIGSMVRLIADEPKLRFATATQTAMFASFSVFWTVLALKLERPPYELGADIAGLFGILGGAGVLAAPIVGKVADRHGPRLAIGIGIGLALGCWLLIGVSLSLTALVIGVILLDVGVQCAMISNQHVVFSLRPEARNRMNTIFVGGLFVGGALGSAGASLLWLHDGWIGVCLLGGGLAGAAFVIHLLGAVRPKALRV